MMNKAEFHGTKQNSMENRRFDTVQKFLVLELANHMAKKEPTTEQGRHSG